MTQIQLDALLLAYVTAGRLLDAGMRRPCGATTAGWQNADDPRDKLRAARLAYIAVIREMIGKSAAYHRRVFGEEPKSATGAASSAFEALTDSNTAQPLPA